MSMTQGTRRRWRLLAVFCCFMLALSPFAPVVGRNAGADSRSGGDGATTTAASADTTPPVLSQPDNLTVAAVDASGAVVTYRLPHAIDDVDGEVPVNCNPNTGSLFPLGSTAVTCIAQDQAGNQASVSFVINVTDQTPPVIGRSSNIVVQAESDAGAVVDYPVPGASDNVDGTDSVACSPGPGTQFPIGNSVVTCTSQDAAGNQAAPVSFDIDVQPLPPTPTPVPTVVPTPTDTPSPSPTDAPTDTPPATAASTATSSPTTMSTATSATTTGTMAADPTGTATAGQAGTATGGETANSSAPTGKATGTVVPPLGTLAATVNLENLASAAPSPTPKTNQPLVTPDGPHDAAPAGQTPTQQALTLPWPPPADFTLATDGGPLGILTAIWGNLDFPISQEFGHTSFSIDNFQMYAYGLDYGLDGYEHPGIDIGMPAGTWLYSPIDGTVIIAGGVPYYTFYGNGQPGVGELMIQDDQGNEVILGHMGRIAVDVGQRVKAGQFVGLSGGDNGDHLHLETREIQSGGYRIVDPRQSFLVTEMRQEHEPGPTAEPTATPTPSSTPAAPVLTSPSQSADASDRTSWPL